MITPATCRAARGLLDWRQIELAKRSGVWNTQISDYERGEAKTGISQASVDMLQMTFEEAGIVFLVEGVVLVERLAAPRFKLRKRRGETT